MKKLIFTLLTLLIISCSTTFNSNRDEIYSIQIVEFYTDKIKIITIDNFGIACLKNNPQSWQSIDVESINKNISTFINNINVTFEKGNNFALPEREFNDDKDKKSVYVRVVMKKDYIKDLNLINKSCYMEKYINVSKDFNNMAVYDLIGYVNFLKLKNIKN